MGAIDTAALGPSKKQAHHGHGRENEKSLLYFGCDFSGWYSFRKIIKTVATRCQILKPECAKRWGAYSAPQDPELDLRGLLLRGRIPSWFLMNTFVPLEDLRAFRYSAQIKYLLLYCDNFSTFRSLRTDLIFLKCEYITHASIVHNHANCPCRLRYTQNITIS